MPSARAKGAGTLDAIKLLTQDHEDVRRLFTEYERIAKLGAESSDRQALAERICMMLTVHATLEEEIFYPAAKDKGVEVDLLDEAEVEHASAKNLITQIRGMAPEDDLYDAKVKVLGEYIDHHVKEEQDEMFPKCRKAKLDVAGVAQVMAERRVELMAEISEEIIT